ncbi:MAG: hypothetical protein P0Y66_02055 [Candidatus Kaistia colombiensis]|nr:MAG: hypothetical protein P0Y66_02055 [Kaistia sp.]
MATIRKRGAAWQAQVRRQGYPLLTKSFPSHADAQAWARDQERSIDRAELPTNQAELKTVTLRDLLDRYEREITPTKRGADRECSKLSVLKRHSLASATLNRLSGAMVASYRDDRLQEVSGGTVRRELAILRHCFEVARKEWGFRLIGNPVRDINLPKPSEARTRRLDVSDVARFWVELPPFYRTVGY